MDSKHMTAILGFILVGLGGYLAYHVRTQIGKDNNLKPKSEVLREVNLLLPKLRDLKSEWRKIQNVNQKKRNQIDSKFINDLEQHASKSDSLRLKEIEVNDSYRRKYEEEFKPEAKRIKYETEIFLNEYRQNETSYAEYDRVFGDYDLDKIINDLDALKSKTQVKSE